MILRSRPEILRPHVLVAYRAGIPDAILVGRLESTRLDLKFGYGRLLRPRVRSLTFVREGLLGNASSANCRAFLACIEDSLLKGEADMAFLSHLRVGSEMANAAAKTLKGFGRAALTAPQFHRVMSLPGGSEELYSRLFAKVRKNLRWQARKIVQDFGGKVLVARLSELSDLDAMSRDVEAVAKKTYQRGLGVGFVDNAEMRRRLDLMASKKRLCAYVLYIEDRPIAFWMGTVYKGTLHSDCMGYDPAYAKYSPGMFLIMKATEDLADHRGEYGVTEIDFGLGDAQYKEVLGTSEWKDASAYIFAPRIRGAAMKVLWTLNEAVESAARGVLRTGGLVRRVKKKWRERLRSQPVRR